MVDRRGAVWAARHRTSPHGACELENVLEPQAGCIRRVSTIHRLVANFEVGNETVRARLVAQGIKMRSPGPRGRH